MENKTIKININKNQFWKTIIIKWKNNIKWNFKIDLPSIVKTWDKFKVDWYNFEIKNITKDKWNNIDWNKATIKNKIIVGFLFLMIPLTYTISKKLEINSLISWFLIYLIIYTINERV